MKKTLFFIILILNISCSNSDENTKITFNTLTTSSVRIGDTLVLTGQNFDKIQSFTFTTKYDNERQLPISKTNEYIKIKVPILHNEEFYLSLTPTSGSDTPKALLFNLVGTFPLPSTGLSGDIDHVKMINEKIAYIISDKTLYKTIDGGYTWLIIKKFDTNIYDMFFINENQGWIALSDHSNFTNADLYFTNDGGATFKTIFSLKYPESITKMYFSSLNNGYILTPKGKIYQTSNNSNFNLIYDCQNSDKTNSYWEFNQLSIYKNTLLASGYPSSQSGMIRSINNNYDYLLTNSPIINIQLINETNAYTVMYSNNQYLLYFTNNLNNWQLTNNTNIYNFYFLDQNKGIGISFDHSNSYAQPHDIVYETYNGGQKWVNKFDFQLYGVCKDIDFYENTGLIVGNTGNIWKHIFK